MLLLARYPLRAYTARVNQCSWHIRAASYARSIGGKERVMADLQQIVGTVVRRERQARRLTMKELAARSSVSEVYLGEIERGKKYPSALVLSSSRGRWG